MAKIKYNGNITDLATGKSAVIKCAGKMLDGDVIITGACKIAYEGGIETIDAQQSVVVKGGVLMEGDAIVTATDGGDSGDSGNGDSGGTDTEQYSLSGTWVFNDTITIPNGESLSYEGAQTVAEVEFTCGYNRYSSFCVGTSNNTSWNMLVYESETYGTDVAYMGGWIDQAYRTIIFDGTQTVSKEFYEWFTANAVKQTEGYTFRALYEGMKANIDITVVGNVADLQGDITDVITGYGCHERVADGTIYDNVSIVMIVDLYVNGNDFESITQNALYTYDDNTPINTNADIVAAVGKLCYLIKDCEILYSD